MPTSFDKTHSVCQAIRVCRNCDRIVHSTEKEPHECNKVFCKLCRKKEPIDHLCYMQPVATNPRSKKPTLYTFHDFETQQSETVDGDQRIKIHEPNLCVVQQVCTMCSEESDVSKSCTLCGIRVYIFANKPVEQVVELALARRENIGDVILIAHNAQSYDLQFIWKYLIGRKELRNKPEVVISGSKIILLTMDNVKFIDSLNFLHMPLSALPKAFGLPNMEKGHFPHLFNRPENENYVGEMPPCSTYSPGSMKRKEREEFLEWYEEKKRENYLFNFKYEIVKYCRQDVTILRLACLAFRKNFMKCASTDPLKECVTIASACMQAFRRKFLKQNTIGIMPRGGYRLCNKQSLKAIQWLGWMENVLRCQIQHSRRSREKRLVEGPLVDGYYELLDGTRVVLQFHGCYWHGCIKCRMINRDLKLTDGDTMDERFERTLRISKKIKDSGYVLIEKWECDFDKECLENAELKNFVEQVAKNHRAPLEPRDAFFGGRTGNTAKYYEIQNEEKIRYVDVCSLYPYILKYGRYPVGHPTLYVGEVECRRLIGQYNNISNVDGLILAEILPPRNLYHAVLPVRMHKKLLFPLCRTCAEEKNQKECNHEDPDERVITGTYVADELKKAVEKGYIIRRVFEIWAYEMTQYDKSTGEGGLFNKYVDNFFIEKTHASGFPPECGDDETAKDRYIEEFLDREGIRLDKNCMIYNAGARSVAKISLNSFWGKLGQRENMPKTEIVEDAQRLFEMLTSHELDVSSIIAMDDETLYVTWLSREKIVEPSPICSVVHASYTTALARLKLYSELERIGERVLYYDTDSIIYISRGKSGEYEPNIGSFLGELTDEFAGSYGVGAYASIFVSGGPKFYGYKCLSVDGSEHCECKIKGIRFNSTVDEKINFDSMCRLVKGEIPPMYITYEAIRRTPFHDVVTRPESKICETIYDKRRFVSDEKSYPFGYKKNS